MPLLLGIFIRAMDTMAVFITWEVLSIERESNSDLTTAALRFQSSSRRSTCIFCAIERLASNNSCSRSSCVARSSRSDWVLSAERECISATARSNLAIQSS